MTGQALLNSRITRKFSQLESENRKAFIAFLTAGDPDYETSERLIFRLPKAGVDVIEIGMPFSDPMADGPAIQASSQRALKAGMTLKKTLDLVRRFREHDAETPIVLMGYYNPIYRHGSEKFVHDAVACGADGLIIVDLPPEEDSELCDPALAAGLHWIRLVTPTTDNNRIKSVLRNVSGFVYYISVLGVTGTASAVSEQVGKAVDRLRQYTDLPIAVGFGIKTPKNVSDVAKVADGIVVGSAIVELVQNGLDENGHASTDLVDQVHSFVKELAAATASA